MAYPRTALTDRRWPTVRCWSKRTSVAILTMASSVAARVFSPLSTNHEQRENRYYHYEWNDKDETHIHRNTINILKILLHRYAKYEHDVKNCRPIYN